MVTLEELRDLKQQLDHAEAHTQKCVEAMDRARETWKQALAMDSEIRERFENAWSAFRAAL